MADQITDQQALHELAANECSKIAQIFDGLGLPIPQDNENMMAARGQLLFMEEYGCVVRIEGKRGDANQFWDYRHPAILQPIASFETDTMFIRIYPGIKAGVSEEDAQSVLDSLSSDGLRFGDKYQSYNYGYLPLKTPVFPRGIPVILDPPSIEKLNSRKTDEDSLPPETRPQVIHGGETGRRNVYMQDLLFGKLKFAFEQAWPLAKRSFTGVFNPQVDLPNKEKMAAFWKSMKEATHPTDYENCTLVASWTDPSIQNDPENIKAGSVAYYSKAYAGTLRKNPPSQPSNPTL